VPVVSGVLLLDSAAGRPVGGAGNALAHLALPAALLGYFSLAYISA